MQSLYQKLLLSCGVAGALTGCHPAVAELLLDEVTHLAAHVAVDAVVGAALTAPARQAHQEHPAVGHHLHCGHDYVLYDEREVYYVAGRWEFYEPHEGRWFYFVDGAPWE